MDNRTAHQISDYLRGEVAAKRRAGGYERGMEEWKSLQTEMQTIPKREKTSGQTVEYSKKARQIRFPAILALPKFYSTKPRI